MVQRREREEEEGEKGERGERRETGKNDPSRRLRYDPEAFIVESGRRLLSGNGTSRLMVLYCHNGAI